MSITSWGENYHRDPELDIPECLSGEVEEIGEIGHAPHEGRGAADVDFAQLFILEQLVVQPPLHQVGLDALLDLSHAVLLEEIDGLVPDQKGGVVLENLSLDLWG